MGLLTPCFVPGEGFLYTIIVPGGGFLLPSSRVPGVCPGGGMVLDEIDTCIIIKQLFGQLLAQYLIHLARDNQYWTQSNKTGVG